MGFFFLAGEWKNGDKNQIKFRNKLFSKSEGNSRSLKIYEMVKMEKKLEKREGKEAFWSLISHQKG